MIYFSMRRIGGMLAVAILAVLGAGGSFHQGSQHQGGRVVPGPRFETLPPGWHAFDDRPNLLNSRGGSAMLIGTAWRFNSRIRGDGAPTFRPDRSASKSTYGVRRAEALRRAAFP